LAVNDRLKLSADTVIPLTDARAAEDMRALGVLIVHALGQKIQNSNGIPQPLAEIVRHCLDPDSAKRWTVEQVQARLNAPAIVSENLPRSEENPDADGPKPKAARMPKWIYAALAALILLTLILATVLRNNNSAPVATPVAAAAQQDLQAPATPAETPQPAPSQNANRPGAAGITARATERKSSGWSVIVGAYRSRELAEKRMREMTKKWPNFQITVIESPGEKTPYLLVLGQNLSEDQAKALRQRAFQSRLPGDTYIKRLM